MDKDDRQQDLIQLLTGPMSELKDIEIRNLNRVIDLFYKIK
jgi:hypothetical protein